ncbi:hypothetical protein Q7P37_006435 [Cladosporium fusiforme]
MLGDNELAATSTQLQDFLLANTKQQETLSEVLEKYGKLIEDYKRLKSDYEEERDSRERYKQMARGQERNPFVLVLVDGDGYIFDDDLVSSGAEGGQRAAHLLNDAVLASLRSRGLENCRIMVRVYTNLVGLSKALSRLKLCGAEKRSLAAFAANFTRTNELFDFVDAGELKENADSKIRALFRQFVDNTQCRHIYFAGCHDVGYINELIPHRNNRDKITLVRNYATHPEFGKLGMRIEELPGIFRTAPLDPSNFHPQVYKAPSAMNKLPLNAETHEPEGRPCHFFQKGLCKHGKNCTYLHIKTNSLNGSSTTQNISPNLDAASWRNAPDSKFTAPNDSDFMRGNIPTGPAASQGLQPDINFSALLPHSRKFPPGHVAVNAKNERIDMFMPPASLEDRQRFAQRIAVGKLCNKFHLLGECADGSDCSYDHGSIDEGMRNYLRSVAASTPCPRRNGCRNLLCLNGHVCQKPDCKYRGGKVYCKLPGPVHYVHLGFKEFVQGNIPQNKTGDGVSVPGADGSSSPTPSSQEEQGVPTRFSNGFNVMKSVFGVTRALSEDKSTTMNAADSDDDELAGKAGAKLNLDSDLE